MTSRLKRFLVTTCGVILLTAFGLWLLYMDMHPGNVEIQADKVTQTSETVPGDAPSEPDFVAEGKIDLNTADVEALKSLPGIGASLAERIVAFRDKTPFKTVRDIKKVSGIGDEKFCGD